MNRQYVEDLLKSLYIMASLVEARDPYTGGHLWRVSQYARLLAEDAGLPGETVARIALGGFLHDLGKIGVADAILNKPGRLSEEEYAVIKTHPEVGSRLLADHPLAGLVRSAVLSHHETPDGHGYPHQLSGEAISVDARIVGICDAFDAMTSSRPYRRGMAKAVALDIIRERLGSQFDPEWGAHFIALDGQGVLDHIIGHSEPGIPVQVCPFCGPTIVVTRRHGEGSRVYCRACGNEAIVERDRDHISLKPTGRRGSPADLEPDIDQDLIQTLVRDSAPHLEPTKPGGL